jgi:hypothetical protein
MVAASCDPEKINMISLRRIVTVSMANRSKTLCSLFVLASLASLLTRASTMGRRPVMRADVLSRLQLRFPSPKGHRRTKSKFACTIKQNFLCRDIVHGTSQVEISQITIQLEAGRIR